MATEGVLPSTEDGAVDAEGGNGSAVEQAEPIPPSASAEEVASVQHAKPFQQAEPVQQVEPVQQAEPIHQASAEQIKPDSPVAAVPLAPSASAVPTAPTEPTSSAVVADMQGGVGVKDGIYEGGGEADIVADENAEELSDAHRATLEIVEKRIERLLAENAAMCGEYAQVTKDLQRARAVEEDLDVAWQAASNMKVRQKMVAQSQVKNAQSAGRTELQRATEAAKQLFELKEVHSQMTSVNRQLVFAVELQARALAESGNRAAAKARNIQRLELALYKVIAHAQGLPGLEESVSGLVSRCGPLVHGALSREAQRRALQLTAPHAA